MIERVGHVCNVMGPGGRRMLEEARRGVRGEGGSLT